MKDVPFNTLEDKILDLVVRGSYYGNDALWFHTVDGDIYVLHHAQDCCECVEIEDICGDLNDLQGALVVLAEESSNSDDPPPKDCKLESYTWTFYRIRTNKGDVTIRWFGTSNGYYSERVDFAQLTVEELQKYVSRTS